MEKERKYWNNNLFFSLLFHFSFSFSLLRFPSGYESIKNVDWRKMFWNKSRQTSNNDADWLSHSYQVDRRKKEKVFSKKKLAGWALKTERIEVINSIERLEFLLNYNKTASFSSWWIEGSIETVVTWWLKYFSGTDKVSK